MATLPTFVDLVEVYIDSGTTGALQLGAAVSGFRGVEALTDGASYSYSIHQPGEYEAGVCSWLADTQTLIRSPTISSRGNGPIEVRAGSSVAFTVLSADLNSALQISQELIDTVTAAAAAAQAAYEAVLGIAVVPEVFFITEESPTITLEREPLAGLTLVLNGTTLNGAGDTPDYTRVGKVITLQGANFQPGNIVVAVAGQSYLVPAVDAANVEGLPELLAGKAPNAFSQSPTVGAGTVGAKLQQTANPLDAPWLAAGDGSTNDTAAIATATAARPLVITGNHYIAANVTIVRPLLFAGYGRLTIASGVTVTFAPAALITAPSGQQIFYGAGAVAGLLECCLDWFIGDYRAVQYAANPTVDVRALIQKAVNATLDAGRIYSEVPGTFLFDGSTPVTLGGQSLQLAGQRKTVFIWPTDQCNGFHFLGEQTTGDYRDRGGTISGFGFQTRDLPTIPAAGTALFISQADRNVEDVFFDNPYQAIDVTRNGGGAGAHIRQFESRGARRFGLRTDALNDVFISHYLIVADFDWVILSNVVGTPIAGENWSSTSGAAVSGSVRGYFGGGISRLIQPGGAKLVAGQTLSFGTSGATATVVEVRSNHQIGGIRWNSKNESVTLAMGDVIGGDYSMTTYGTGSAGREDNAYWNRIADSAYFDTSWFGALLDGVGGTVIDGWFSSTRQPGSFGLALVNARMIRGHPHCVNNAGAGVQWDTTDSRDIHFTDIDCDGNCVSPGAMPNVAEIVIFGTASDARWSLKGGRAGYTGANGVTPAKGLYIVGGDGFKVIGFNCPAGSVVNLATSPNQYWTDVNGMPDRSPLYTDAADDAAAGTVGVPVGGFYRTGSIIKQKAT